MLLLLRLAFSLSLSNAGLGTKIVCHTAMLDMAPHEAATFFSVVKKENIISTQPFAKVACVFFIPLIFGEVGEESTYIVTDWAANYFHIMRQNK